MPVGDVACTRHDLQVWEVRVDKIGNFQGLVFAVDGNDDDFCLGRS